MVVVAGLYLARDVLIPITLAVLLSFVLAPLANLLRRFRLGRVGSVLVAVALAIGIVIVIGTVIGSQVANLAPRLPEYTGTIETKIQRARGYDRSRFCVAGPTRFAKQRSERRTKIQWGSGRTRLIQRADKRGRKCQPAKCSFAYCLG